MRKLALVVAGIGSVVIAGSGGLGCSAGRGGAAGHTELATGRTAQAFVTESQSCPNPSTDCTGITKCGTTIKNIHIYDGFTKNYPADSASPGVAPVAMRSGLAFCIGRVSKNSNSPTGWTGVVAQGSQNGRGCSADVTAENDGFHDPKNDGALAFLKHGLTDGSQYYTNCPANGLCPNAIDGMQAHCTPGKVNACYAGPDAGGNGDWITYKEIRGYVDFQFNPNDGPDQQLREKVFDKNFLVSSSVDKCGMYLGRSEFKILTPVTGSKGSGVILYDVPNRGNQTALLHFQGVPGTAPAGTLSQDSCPTGRATENVWGYPDYRAMTGFSRKNAWALAPDAGDPQTGRPLLRSGDTIISSAWALFTKNVLPGTEAPGTPANAAAYDTTVQCKGEDDTTPCTPGQATCPGGAMCNDGYCKDTSVQNTGCANTTSSANGSGAGSLPNGRLATYTLKNGGSTTTWSNAAFDQGSSDGVHGGAFSTASFPPSGFCVNSAGPSGGGVACSSDNDCASVSCASGAPCPHLCSFSPSTQEFQMTGSPAKLAAPSSASCNTDLDCTNPDLPKCLVSQAGVSIHRCVPGCVGAQPLACFNGSTIQGTCVGGNNNGAQCTANAQCTGAGAYCHIQSCTNDADCGGGGNTCQVNTLAADVSRAQCNVAWNYTSQQQDALGPLGLAPGLTCNVAGATSNGNGRDRWSTGLCQCPGGTTPELVGSVMQCNPRSVPRRPASDFSPDPNISLTASNQAEAIEVRWWKSPAGANGWGSGTPALAGQTAWDSTSGTPWCNAEAQAAGQCGTLTAGTDWNLVKSNGQSGCSGNGQPPNGCTHIRASNTSNYVLSQGSCTNNPAQQCVSNSDCTGGVCTTVTLGQVGFTADRFWGVHYYNATHHVVHGIGYPQLRETAAFFRYSTSATNPLNGVVGTLIMHGSSQTGMLLKDFLYRGYNTLSDSDYTGVARLADGMFISQSGAKRYPGGVGEEGETYPGFGYQRYQYDRVPGITEQKTWPSTGQIFDDTATPADFPFTYASLPAPHGWPAYTGTASGQDGILLLCSARCDCPSTIEHFDTAKEIFHAWASRVWTYEDRQSGQLRNAPGLGRWGGRWGVMADLVGGTQHIPSVNEVSQNCGTGGAMEVPNNAQFISWKHTRYEDMKVAILTGNVRHFKAKHPHAYELVVPEGAVCENNPSQPCTDSSQCFSSRCVPYPAGCTSNTSCPNGVQWPTIATAATKYCVGGANDGQACPTSSCPGVNCACTNGGGTCTAGAGVNVMRDTGSGDWTWQPCTCPGPGGNNACPVGPNAQSDFGAIVGGVYHRSYGPGSLNLFEVLEHNGPDGLINTADDQHLGVPNALATGLIYVPSIYDKLGNMTEEYALLPVELKAPVATYEAHGIKGSTIQNGRQVSLAYGEEFGLQGGMRVLTKQTADLTASTPADSRCSFNQMYCVDESTPANAMRGLGQFQNIWNCVKGGASRSSCFSQYCSAGLSCF